MVDPEWENGLEGHLHFSIAQLDDGSDMQKNNETIHHHLASDVTDCEGRTDVNHCADAPDNISSDIRPAESNGLTPVLPDNSVDHIQAAKGRCSSINLDRDMGRASSTTSRSHADKKPKGETAPTAGFKTTMHRYITSPWTRGRDNEQSVSKDNLDVTPPHKVIDNLTRQLMTRDKEIARLNEELMEVRSWCNSWAGRSKENARGLRDLDTRYARLEQNKDQLEEELREEKRFALGLQERLSAQEQVITQVHSTAISRLAQGVSTDLPDDKIRSRLHYFFEQDVRGWCMDFRAKESKSLDDAMRLMASFNIISNAMDVPCILQRSMSSTTLTGLMLETAVMNHLCWKFLEDPFFLNPDVFNIDNLNEFPKAPAVNWRIHTCEFLETVFSPSKQTYMNWAKEFATRFSGLLQPLDEEGFNDLAGLFEIFSKLALRLWKRKAHIYVERLDIPTLKTFKAVNGDMEAHPSVPIEAGGKRMDGQDVQVLVRPRIACEPVLDDGSLGERVVWSNALIWTSNSSDVADVNMEQNC